MFKSVSSPSRRVSTSKNTHNIATGQAPSRIPAKKSGGLAAKAKSGLKGGFAKAGYGKGTVSYR